MGGAFVIVERVVGQGTERELIYLLSIANKFCLSRATKFPNAFILSPTHGFIWSPVSKLQPMPKLPKQKNNGVVRILGRVEIVSVSFAMKKRTHFCFRPIQNPFANSVIQIGTEVRRDACLDFFGPFVQPLVSATPELSAKIEELDDHFGLAFFRQLLCEAHVGSEGT
jgi:hypothetical protein